MKRKLVKAGRFNIDLTEEPNSDVGVEIATPAGWVFYIRLSPAQAHEVAQWFRVWDMMNTCHNCGELIRRWEKP